MLKHNFKIDFLDFSRDLRVMIWENQLRELSLSGVTFPGCCFGGPEYSSASWQFRKGVQQSVIKTIWLAVFDKLKLSH